MRTALYDRHIQLGAKMVDFAGWEMPIQYSGIVREHLAVRNKAGLFDVSHMGCIHVEGPDAEEFLDYLSTNKIKGKQDFSATYTVWCAENGTCIDDVIIYKISQTHFFVIVNASNRQKDLDHLQRESQKFNVRITPYFSGGIIAIQGPQALPIVSKIFPEASTLENMHFKILSFNYQNIYLSATGYTGAGGFEIYGNEEAIVELWDRLLNEGNTLGIIPVGLGARDTLRLEKGYALYGHELSEEIVASETVSAWTIKKAKKNFLGEQAIDLLENTPQKRHSYGIVLKDKGIARQGHTIWKEGHQIGRVTSGTFSPSLNKAIAIGLVTEKLQPGNK